MRIVKPSIFFCIACAVAIAFGSTAENSRLKSFAAYVAGVELIWGDKSLSAAETVKRYRKLRVVTGVNGPQAKEFVTKLKNDPAGWQKFEESVTELLQKKE